MKRRSCFMLAVLLMLTALVIVPASADVENKGRSYDVYKLSETITVDGVLEDAWVNVPWSDTFVNWSGSETKNYEAKMKAVWKPVEGNDNAADLYLALKITGVESYASDIIRVKIDDGRMYTGSKADKEVYKDNGYFTEGVKYYFWNGGIYLKDTDGAKNGVAYINCDSGLANCKYAEQYTYAIKTDAATKTCIVEFCRRIEKPSDAKVLFDWSISRGYSWNGSNNNVAAPVPQGVLNLLNKEPELIDETRDVLFKKDGQTVASINKNANGAVVLPNYDKTGTALMLGWTDGNGKLYPVGGTYTVSGTEQVVLTAAVLEYSLLEGAAVLIQEPTALRFEVKADADVLTALGAAITEKGVILTKTADLTADVIADTVIDAAELDAANIAYEKITLTDSEEAGLYYAVKSNVTDLSLAYSAAAYLTVKYADETTKTLSIAGYSAENNSRCVKDVAEAAYADRSNVRADNNGVNYAFKVSKDYAVGDYTLFSYSPYTEEQLDLLAKLSK